MIKAVTFDLWQTLITEKPEEEEDRRALRFQRLGEELRALGFDPELEALQEAYQACGLWLQGIWKQDRDVPTREHVAFLLRALSLEPRDLKEADWERLEEAYTSPIKAIPPVVLPGAAETLRRLEAKGLWLGLVCNTGRTPGKVLRPLLSGMGLSGSFRAMAFSDEAGIRKPDPGIYHCVLGESGFAPHQAVHVGDLAESDIVGAKRAGMLALHLVRDGRPPSPEADGILQSVSGVPEWIAGRGTPGP